MKGNFNKYQRLVDKIDNITSSNIRNLLNREQEILMDTEADDFNKRFKMETVGVSLDIDDEHHSDIEMP